MKNNFDTNQFAAAADRFPVNFEEAMKIIDKIVSIYGHRNRQLFSKRDLDDVRQKIYIKVYRNLSSFDPAKASDRAKDPFKTWVNRIAENALKDAFNAKMRHNSKFVDPISQNRDDDEYFRTCYGSYRGNEFETDRDICLKEDMSYIRQTFDSRPRQYREILRLDVEEYSTAEIADMLGCTKEKVYLLRHRAQKAYAKRLGKEFLTEHGIAA